MRALVLCCLVLAGCSRDRTASLSVDLVVPASLTFDETYVGSTGEAQLALINRSRLSVTLQVETSSPFAAASTFDVPSGATVMLPVTFSALESRAFEGVLHLASNDATWDVTLKASALAVPDCGAAEACHARHFVPVEGCVELAQADGTSCSNACLLEGACMGGACVGTPRSCDDGNACTTDACNVALGCQHVETQCESDNPCFAARCDAETGCSVTPVEDGVRCGENDCQTAQVCMAGACVARPSPENSECGASTGCQSAARCAAGTCVRSSEPGLPPVLARVDVRDTTFQRVVLAGDGTVYAATGTGYVGQTRLEAPLIIRSWNARGGSRFSVDLTLPSGPTYAQGLMLDESHSRLIVVTSSAAESSENRLVMLDTVNGRRLWAHDLATNIPAYDPYPGSTVPSLSAFQLALGDDVVLVDLAEGSSSHSGYLLAIDSLTGTERWRVTHEGHTYAFGLSKEGTTWVMSAACWSSDNILRVIDAQGQTLETQHFGGWPLAYSEGSLLAWNRSAFNVIAPAAAPRVLSQSPADLITGVGVAWRGSAVFFARGPNDAPKLVRLDSGSGAELWSVPIPPDPNQLRVLQDDGVALAFVPYLGPPSLELRDATGAKTEACVLDAPVSVFANGRVLAKSVQTVILYSVPGARVATDGWTGVNGTAGSNRAR